MKQELERANSLNDLQKAVAFELCFGDDFRDLLAKYQKLDAHELGILLEAVELRLSSESDENRQTLFFKCLEDTESNRATVKALANMGLGWTNETYAETSLYFHANWDAVLIAKIHAAAQMELPK